MQDFIEAEQNRFEECFPIPMRKVDRMKDIGWSGETGIREKILDEQEYNREMSKWTNMSNFLRYHDQRLIAKIVEMVEGKKVVEASLPSDDPRVLMWKARHNKTLNEILTTLKGK